MGGGVFSTGGSLVLTNDTFTADTATGGAGNTGGTACAGLGGAVFVRNGTLTATFDTFSGNTAAQGATDLYVLSDGGGNKATATVVNSILGQNAAATVSDFFANTNGGGTAANLAGSKNDLLSLNATGANALTGTNIAVGSPNFAAAGLADNGGPTKTFALTAPAPSLWATGRRAPASRSISAGPPQRGHAGHRRLRVDPPAPTTYTVTILGDSSGSAAGQKGATATTGDLRDR